jgi:hypothetical protein
MGAGPYLLLYSQRVSTEYLAALDAQPWQDEIAVRRVPLTRKRGPLMARGRA